MSSCASAQTKDTSSLYKKIKKFSYKRKITRILYESLFKETTEDNNSKTENNKVESLEKYEACIIRSIKINVSDPFENENLELTSRNNFLKRWVNRFHFSTKNWVIANKLLFKKNQPLSTLKVRESERLIRQSGYINDVEISAVETEEHDSVDIFVEVKDKWSITVPVEIKSYSRAKGTFINKNLLGLGQYFEQSADIDLNGENIYLSRYYIENIKNTFISTNLFSISAPKNQTIGFEISRPSSSILIKWSGGQYFENNIREVVLNSQNGIKENFSIHSFYNDTWISKRFPLKIKSRLDEISGFTLGARYFIRKHQNRPAEISDWDNNYANHNGFLCIGNIYLQRFYKEKFIYRFGSFEDVPVGLIFQLTHGFTEEEFQLRRNYSSIFFRGANKFKIGYWSTSIVLATYHAPKINNEVFFRTSVYFFSKLRKIFNWSFRQFIQIDFMKDVNNNLKKSIQFRSTDIYSIPINNTTGYSKGILNSETIFYAPYQFSGFRFAPVILLGSGFIQEQSYNWKDSKVYYSLALGILLRNENLLNSTFQFSVGYYPVLPPGQNKNFITEPVTSFTLRVNGFSVFKPDFADY